MQLRGNQPSAVRLPATLMWPKCVAKLELRAPSIEWHCNPGASIYFSASRDSRLFSHSGETLGPGCEASGSCRCPRLTQRNMKAT